jgi:hypothetical protein
LHYDTDFIRFFEFEIKQISDGEGTKTLLSIVDISTLIKDH